MALQRWSFKKRGDAATGNPTLATDYVTTFMSQYNTTIPFDGRRRIAYFFDQVTVKENGGDANSVLIGSYEASTQTFYPISTLGVPAGASLVSFRKGRLNIQALLFPALPTPLVANTFIAGLGSLWTSAAIVETMMSFTAGDVTQYANDGFVIEFNINHTYDIQMSTFDGDQNIVAFNDADGLVIVVNERGFFGAENLSTLNIKNATILSPSACEGCISLLNVDFTSINYVRAYALSGCTSLENLDLPAALFLGQLALSGNNSLSFLSVPNVTELEDNVFDGCSALTLLSLPALDICPKFAFSGWGGAGYTLVVPTAMASNIGVTTTQANGTTIVLI